MPCPLQKQFRRLFAIRMIFLGLKLSDISATLGIDRQTMRAWIKRFNCEGIEGLPGRPRSGRPRKIHRELDPPPPVDSGQARGRGPGPLDGPEVLRLPAGGVGPGCGPGHGGQVAA